MRTIPVRLRLLVAVLSGTALAALLLVSPPAIASRGQISLFEDDVQMLTSPGPTLQDLRHLGVNTVRLGVHWSSIAPSPSSRRKPRFNASDPNAYPARNWQVYDTIVRDAAADGIQVMFVPTAFAPLWAQGANPGRYGAHYNVEFAFMPSASAYGQFVRALGTRYSGHFKPRGSKTALPAVHTWELYNEPNFGEDLSPQGINGSHVLYAPVMYRDLLGAGWGALHATGHGRDTILIGALAARGGVRPASSGTGLPGAYGETPPLQFIRELYCLDPSYHQYRGAAAGVRKCPTTAAASRRFRSQNPALFSASGWSIHPYPLTNDANVPPTKTRYNNPDYVAFSQIPNMAKVLDLTLRGYRSGRRFPIWNTEYGYITNPPNASRKYPNASLSNQAYYDNWAEYLSWRNPRIVSTMQYLLVDPNPSVGVPQCGGFASGLVFFGIRPTTRGCSRYRPGATKPGYDAYRLPIFLPSTSTRAGRTLMVWGCVRPARYALLDVHTPQTADIQFQRSPGGPWVTLAAVTIRNPSASCYFNVPVRFPGNGAVRLAFSYPKDVQLQPPAVGGSNPPSPPGGGSTPTTPTTTTPGGYVDPLPHAAGDPAPSPGPGGYVDPLQPAVSRSVAIKIK